MQIKRFLDSVCNQIKYKPIRENIAEELKNHIEEAKENYILEGLKEIDAEEKAIKQMGDGEEIGKKLNKIHRPNLDWKLILIIFVLLCFGGIVLFIRVHSVDEKIFGIEGQSIIKFIIFTIIGIVISIAIYFIDYSKINKYSNIFYILATLSILFALMCGTVINGIPHLRLGTITFSPAVIAPPLYIIAFVGFINNLNKESKLEKIISQYMNIKVNINLLKIIILSIISLMLLIAIPSTTSAFILGLTYLITGTIKIAQMKENKVKNILKLWGIPVIIGIVLLTYILGTSPFRWYRLTLSFNPEQDPSGGGWIGINRKTIIQSAQLIGEAEDISEALTLFDEGTNYAFISILAHYGWIVSIGIIVAILALSIKLIINTIKIKDVYGKLLIVGISTMFILQSIFNILMNLNLWIEANFNLPFVSYGGANLIVNLMSLTLILSVYRRKDIIIIQKNNNVQNQSIIANEKK